MRLHRMEVTGVGTFRSPQAIVFDPLSDSGLFLIDGPTGSGKTTLIDAITFALYGTVAGRESDPSRLRSAYCAADDPTEVILEFSVRGRRHRIARSPEYTRAAKRKTESGVATQRARQNLVEFDSAGNEVLQLTSAQDIGIHVQQLLGMDADQFRQLVVLPQGEFADLLRMSPRARLAALETLLGSAFYTRVQDELLRRAEESREERRAADDAVRSVAQAISGRVGELADLPLGEPRGVIHDDGRTDDERRSALHHVVTSLREAAEAAEILAAQAKAEREQAQAEMANAEQLADAVEALRESRAALQRALAQLDIDHITSEQARSEERDLLERMGKLRLLRDWEADAAVRAEQVRAQEGVRAEAEQSLVELEATAATLPNRIAELDARITDAERLIGDIPRLTTQVEELEKTRDAIDELVTLDTQEAALVTQYDDAQSSVSAMHQAVRDAETALEQIQMDQLAQRASQLAHDLVPGAPCPVCGATEHPAPARGETGSLIEVTDVEAARAELAQSRTAYEGAEAHRKRAEAALRASQTLRAELTGRVGVATRIEVDERLTALRAEVELAGSTDLPTLRSDLAALRTMQGTIAQDEKLARARLTASQSELGALAVAEQDRRQEIADIAGEHGSASQAFMITQTRLAALDQAREALEAQALASARLTAEQLGLDPADVVRRRQEAAHLRDRAVQRAESAADRAAVFANTIIAIDQLADAFLAALDERQAVAARAEVPVSVADIATARSPANRRKLTLASYAVQLRFAHVLESASMHLERMSSGQYSFQLSEAFRGREQSGLGIEVVDSWTGQARDPRSLSGGETFYAALALALGLADVVHSETGGTQLETLFVDEGFGSLDQDTLQLVLDQLDHLRSGGRVVGVISHVTEMKERISDRIQVRVLPDHTSEISQIPGVSV
jgi:DNA repair protein SbcC/Rad50